MKPSFVVTFDGRWRIARLEGQQVDLRDVTGPVTDATNVRQVLQEMGYVGGGVCLALSSRDVVSAKVNCADVPRNRRRNAMLCLLEEQLPLDIESMTADFLPPAGNWALGVAVESAKVKALVEPLESAGIEVAAICPLAMMAVWELCRADEKCDYVLIRSGKLVDIFRLKNLVPVAWYTVSDDIREIRECIMADQLTDPVESDPCVAWVVAEAQWPSESLIGKLALRVVSRRPEDPLAIAAAVAEEVLKGGQAGWVNLRRDALAMSNPWLAMRGPVRSAVVLAVLLPVVLAAAFFCRAMSYQTEADSAYRQETAIYRQSRPNQPVPRALNTYLRSELARLTGVSGASGQIPPRVNALEILRQVVASFDSSRRLRIFEIRVGPNDVIIDGQTLTHSDAEAISRSLIANGFAMDPPRTEAIPNGGVTFALAGHPPSGSVPPPAVAEEPEQAAAAAEPASQPIAATQPDSQPSAATEQAGRSASAVEPTSERVSSQPASDAASEESP